MEAITWEQNPHSSHKKPAGIIIPGLELTKNQYGVPDFLLGCKETTLRMEVCEFLPPAIDESGERILDCIILEDRRDEKVKRFQIIAPEEKIQGELSPKVVVRNAPDSFLLRIKAFTPKQTTGKLRERSNALGKSAFSELQCGYALMEGPPPEEIVKLNSAAGIWIDVLLMVHKDTKLCVTYTNDNDRQGIDVISFDIEANAWQTVSMESVDPVRSVKMRMGISLQPEPEVIAEEVLEEGKVTTMTPMPSVVSPGEENQPATA